MKDITNLEFSPKEKTATALGIFDGLHIGHKEIINRTLSFTEKGLKSAVFCFNSSSVTSKKNYSVILKDEEKKTTLEKMGVDYIFSPNFEDFKDLSAEEFVDEVLVKKLNSAVCICGDDFRFSKGAKAGEKELKMLCEKRNISVVTVDSVLVDGERVSSTLVREKLQDGDVEYANKLLGYRFFYEYPVLHGKKLGRTLGFPTINQTLPQSRVHLKFGVYETRVSVFGKEYKGITNVGVKPTVMEEKSPCIETYIIGFEGDLYGQTVKVEFVRFMREEKKFSDLSKLRETVLENIEEIKKSE